MDTFTKKKRSEIMSKIRSKDTTPEKIIRRLIWKAGKRYRIHPQDVLGHPDIVNRKKKIAVFLDGCFWHGCPKCYQEPKSNVEYWRNKIKRNKKRRQIVKKSLQESGWKVLEFWEHDIKKNPEKISNEIIKYL